MNRWPRLSGGKKVGELDQLFEKKDMSREKYRELYEGSFDPPPQPRWVPPEGATTAAAYTFEEARRLLIGKDAIVRDDPYFGRRGIIKKIIADERCGFLVAVHVYKRTPERSGKWEELSNAPPDARKFLEPGRVEI